MTVSATTRRVTYAGDGISKIFPVPFKFLERGDLRVVQALASGVETTLTLDTDFGVTGAGLDSGGVVTAVVAPPSGARLQIKRVTPKQQPVDFTPFDAFPAEVQERALDRSILIDQENGDDLTRALLAPEADEAIGRLTLPTVTARAARVLGFDTMGVPVAGPLISDLTSLIAIAFTPGLTSLGSAVTFTAAGAGAQVRSIEDKARERLSLMDFIPANLRAAIRAGTNVTVLTAFMAIAVAACPDGGTIYAEAGKYRGTMTIPTAKNVSIEGDGDATVFEAALAGDTVINRIGDTRREGGSRMARFRVDGRNLGSVTGIKLGNQAVGGDALLQQAVTDVTAQGCYAGIELGNIQESHFSNVTCQFNTVGLLGESSPTGGGITTLLFANVHWQQNDVGLFVKSNSIFPISSWLFSQCMAQANGLCGISLHGAVGGMGLIYGVNFNILHLEQNGYLTAPGATLTVRGKVVERAGVQIEGAVVTMSGGQLGESLPNLRTYVLRNDTRVTFVDGELGGGDKVNIECDATSRVILEGRVGITGSVNGVSDFAGAYLTGAASLQGKPRRINSPYPKNLYAGTGLNPNAPEAQSAIGCTPSKHLDMDRGDVQRVVYGASAGSTAANRVIFKPIGVPVAIGDQIAIEVDVRATAPTNITLYPLGGGSALRGPQSFAIGTDWTCIVLFGQASQAEASGFDLYAYPTNAGGPTVDFAEMMTVRVAAGGDLDPVHDMVRRGLYDDMKQPVYATGIPTSGTWPRGKRIINSVPAVGAARAWVKVTTGATNVLGTDWINEGNL